MKKEITKETVKAFLVDSKKSDFKIIELENYEVSKKFHVSSRSCHRFLFCLKNSFKKDHFFIYFKMKRTKWWDGIALLCKFQAALVIYNGLINCYGQTWIIM